ncbi:MAG: hypothetical protein A3C30_03755 [Candidatus Levybacteria bacterium RIFCSPHIGHO2_02_FULL_40_18]|nr:MAG: hypothetical protein A2869_00375 [Candidatus Levybacteria bacterium RIFCSPHIGHO2_01_FULL_40_58]OGH26200.1 MAG: hypothetical protein A3C30_03755 [Candidatus Levybacteria bacterium RIFCSPHIGHO2_02_FULL_40_18]OGH31452.1 MAG: hypothetical protein A3E43_02795 [Candidatus Levybacteria bacterium RIFCSPHIGHO2_12_FULL_40_31]OGH40092.1 MAG: hypothetical protein A2894_04115 [Candidatus Levybacteria bacterium RIFCSPLOWO2_01_FULL_40_64]OGH49046.1 MAG: hypothetical protein A3I54_00535 [Candidatus Lev
MKQNDYIRVTGIIFLVIAVLHVLRIFTGFDVEINDYELPVWVSIVGAAIAGYLAYSSQKLKK